ncbi:phage protein NinX family protein [Proteus mirabilis]|uniref:phage protein NinX family protein n=1 Tax=Proteus mirabilis TaxID=584 RepID=UPI003787092B
MNKYTELSDFEINKKVADLVLNGEYISSEENQEVYLATMDGGEFLPIAYFSPCNSPSNAMLIIIENKIAMNPKDNIWQCGSGLNVAENINPLRACMEVFLMMKDAENEKV